MATRYLVTRGYGNGNFDANLARIVTRGFSVNRYGTANLRATLLDNEALSKLVGDRIYRVRLPENPIYPCILYRSSEEPMNHLGGKSELIHKNYEFEIHGPDFLILENISFQLRSAINDGPFEAVLTDLNDDEYQEENRVFIIFLDFSVWQ